MKKTFRGTLDLFQSLLGKIIADASKAIAKAYMFQSLLGKIIDSREGIYLRRSQRFQSLLGKIIVERAKLK